MIFHRAKSINSACYKPLLRQSMKRKRPPRWEGVRKKIFESADKPGSVENHHSSAPYVTAWLKQPTRGLCGPHQRPPIWSCFGRGFPCRRCYQRSRCALTAPFHPYRSRAEAPDLGGIFSVALLRRLAPPRRYLATCPMKPGLSSIPTRSTAMVWPTRGAL